MISPLFNKFKTRYPILDGLHLFKPGYNKVIVYIDLEAVLKTLFTANVNNKLVAQQDANDLKVSLVSNIINLAQHYRWYFIRYNHCECDAYIYWNYPMGDYLNYAHNLSYRTYYNNKMFNSSSCVYLTKCVSECFNTLKIVSKYVNGVNVITSDKVDSSVIPYIIYKEKYIEDNGIRHIIISNDKYDLQYVKYGFDIIVPRQEDTVHVVDNNVIDHMKQCLNVKSDISIPSSYISFILSLLGDKYRNISKISGVGLASIIKMVRTALDNILITENTDDVITLSEIIKDEYRNQFINNYKCTDIRLQYDETPPIDIHDVLNQIEDRYDDNALDMINERYFQNHPILSFYNHKEQVYNRNVEKSIFNR